MVATASSSSPDAVAFDVESLHGRRADERWNRTSVGDILERVAWAEPRKHALIAAPDAIADPRYARITYADADRVANRVTNALLAAGLERSARVAMLCENSVEAFLTKIAIAKAGLVAMPVNTMMAPDVVEHMLRHVGAAAAITDARLWPTKGAPFRAAGVPLLSVIGAPEDERPAGVPAWSAWAEGSPDREPDVRIHGDDIWEILLTSGTTSMPKAVMFSHTYTYMAGMSHALSWTRGLPREGEIKVCSFLPIIYHVGDHAWLFGSLLAGGSTVIGRVPDPAAIAAAVTRERVTCLWGGSAQFLADLVRVVEANPGVYDLRSVGVIVYGWTAIPPDLLARLQQLCDGCEVVGIFGQTESIACHRYWPSRWPELHARTAPATNYVGLPSPLLGSTVVDADGRSLHDRPGEPGEAVYRSPAITAGYFRDEAATREAFRGGWFHSGDMCVYGEEGLRIMIDRYKDVVKSGGENVSSIRVEAVLQQHPAVQRAAVVGVPDERWGEAVTAVIIANRGATIDEAEIIAFCRARLAGFETPKRVVAVDELPVTVGGKVLKYRLRQMLA